MIDIDATLTEQIEACVPPLHGLRGTRFSHVALAKATLLDQVETGGDTKTDGFSSRSNDVSISAHIFENLKSEWYELACTDGRKYSALRKRIKDLRGQPATIIISAIAVALSEKLGIAVIALTPVVGILLHAILTVGNNTLCRMLECKPCD